MEGYQKTLERLVVMSEKEYYTQIVDINRHQVSVARILAWLAVVLTGFNAALFDWIYIKYVDFDNSVLVLTVCFLPLSFAMVTGALAFISAILAIPAIGGYDILYSQSWAEHLNKAYGLLHEKSTAVYETALTDLISRLDIACSNGAITNGKRGAYLRTSSYATIATSLFIALGFLAFSFNYYL
jgi:hypothetical protein